MSAYGVSGPSWPSQHIGVADQVDERGEASVPEVDLHLGAAPQQIGLEQGADRLHLHDAEPGQRRLAATPALTILDG